MIQVLIVEDSSEMQIMLKRILGALGVEVAMAASLKEAQGMLLKNRPGLILLDICLPDGDGFQFCGQLSETEETRTIPFIFISGKEDMATKVAAFSMGAEDYIVKPFHPMELKARLEARIKKIIAQNNTKTLFKKGMLQIDAAQQRAWISVDNTLNVLALTPREFKILFHLVQNEENVLSRNQLLDAVWGNDSSVFDRTVDTHISAIRKKLGQISHYIESVPGSGYRFSVNNKSASSAA